VEERQLGRVVTNESYAGETCNLFFRCSEGVNLMLDRACSKLLDIKFVGLCHRYHQTMQCPTKLVGLESGVASTSPPPRQIFPSAVNTRAPHHKQGHPRTNMDSLTPQDLFSPSKARQQRAQAADWAQIDSWLSYKYAGRTVPTFERNEETLKVLRELSMANERADEERVILERVEREACKELEEDEV
jgi:hypothetical protein